MKQTILFAALGVVAFGAAAQEVGNVISSQPIVQQVAVPRQVCNNQPMMAAPAPNSGLGTVLGALIGGGIGSQIGGGSGRAAAVGVGAVAGALLGTGIESSNNAMAAQAQSQMVPQCSTQTSYENRTVAWNVTYEYAGRQYNVQMPYDPGPTVRLQISPMGSGGSNEGYAQAPQGQGQGAVVTAPPMQSAPQQSAPAQYAPQQYAPQQYAPVQTVAAPMVVPPAPPAQVVYSGYPYPYAQPYPVYPAYRPYYYPPVSLNFGYVYRGGHRH